MRELEEGEVRVILQQKGMTLQWLKRDVKRARTAKQVKAVERKWNMPFRVLQLVVDGNGECIFKEG